MTVATGLVFGSAGLAPVAAAQDEPAPAPAPDLATADGIIAELEQISRDTEAVSEEVNDLDVQVKDKEKELQHAQDELKVSEDRVVHAQNDLKALSADISYFAKKRMRGEIVDPLSAALGSTSAQDAIDRTGYINKMFRDNDEVVARAVAARKDAERGKADALRLQDDIRKQLDDLGKRRAELDKRSADLDGRSEHVKSMVEALSPEQRAIWMTKNNPVTEGLDKLLGSSAAVDAAMSKLGSPYSWGAAGPSEFDCSGLMYWAYQQIGKSIPRTSQAQLAGGTPVSRDQLQPGDIIGYYPGISHVGMYIGNGQIIHASDYGIPVQVVSIDQGGPYQGAVRY
ncbi:MAG: NlpC/P60 family protein [Corynebacterium sp.]|uniref:NlpC/P60 family protein n=1 Tax=Corynebacterium sp. TaxID=1720 RepID=UPI0026DA9D4C|nr:NlpC/P60 family protein [Corynebacterium sp.]MDO5029667.1 NlpC/P60 family protein [Corynebacterium sp.]